MDFSQFKRRFALNLDEQQEAAVQCVHGPALLLAVPGSGKTTVLVSRLGYLFHVAGISPEQTLTMTYTVAAARDMRARYAALFGEEEGARFAFRTINGVCSRIIRLYERMYGRTAFHLLEDGGEKNALVGELYRSQCREYAAEGTVKALQTALTYAKNQMLRGEELSQVEVEGVDFPAFFQAYNQALRLRRQMDYDDQMVYALEIQRRHPQVLHAIQDKYRFISVDEAQDTSKIQHTIIRLLAGKGGNLFLVGDEDQSIYGFRAAFPQALMEFDQVYPTGRILRLERNYRSTQEIVSAADGFIQRNRTRRPKHMTAARGAGAELRERSVYDRKEQYRLLCSIAERCSRETAVLYRDNDSALPLIDLLNRKGIPYRCRQVDSLFFSNRVVRDIGDIIRLAMRPWDGALWMNVYYKLGAGISRSLAQEAAAWGEQTGEPVLEGIISAPAASPFTKKQCRALRTHMEHLLEERGDRAVYRIVHFMGYGEYLAERGIDGGKADILEALGAQEPNPARLLERLEELRGVVQAGSVSGPAPFILSTIHSSKGLEYDRVILADVADGLLPKVLPSQREEEGDACEEERRLFYVGMTRARNELDIITFRKAGLESTFAREVLPKKGQPGPAEAQAGKLPGWGRPAPSPDEGFAPGARLRHKTFGTGTLSSRSGDVAVISFDGGMVKKIALSVAIRSGQLERI